MQTLSIDNTQSPKRIPRELNLKSFQLGLIAIFFFALVVRIGAIAALESWKFPNPMEHRGVALALLRGDGFSFNEFNHYGPSSVQSPPYPLLLAGLFKIFGPDSAGAYITAMIINAFAGALSCVVTGLLARRLGAHSRFVRPDRRLGAARWRRLALSRPAERTGPRRVSADRLDVPARSDGPCPCSPG